MNTETRTELNNENFALISKALSDPNRLQIIQMITDQERCACKLLEHFNISQPTLSHHMRILSDCNLIQTRKEGKWSHYSMNMETMEGYKNYVNMLYKAALSSAVDDVAGESCGPLIAC
jgi:ArsR family transcriptional regulator